MQNNTRSFSDRMQNMHPIPLSICIFLADFFISALFSLVLFPEPEYGNKMHTYALWEQVLLLLIIAPLAETYIFQRLFLEGMVSLTGRKWLSVILIAILFGLAHSYSVPYMVKAFIAGLLYSCQYLLLKAKGYRAFWYTTGTHFTYNLVTLLLNTFTKL